MAITELLVLEAVPFMAAANDIVFRSTTIDWHIFADGFGMLVPNPDFLANWIDSMGFFVTVCKMGFRPGLLHDISVMSPRSIVR